MMAGDWIKMSADLARKPEVISIAAETGLSEDMVVGKLHRIWSWADGQTETGYIKGVTLEWIDREVSFTGFARAMLNAAWLTTRQRGLSFPHFDKHMGQSAKKRAVTAARVQRHRNAGSVTKPSTPCNAPPVTREEKSREEKSGDEETTKEPTGFAACWALIEMKTDRKKALLRWQGKLPLCDKKKHRLEPLADIILAALVRLKAHRDHLLKASEFVPAPKGGDSWIYGMRWEDEIPEHKQYIPLEDRPKLAAPGMDHPAYLKPPGEWKDNGFVHKVSNSFFYTKSRTDGTVVESEQLPTRYS